MSQVYYIYPKKEVGLLHKLQVLQEQNNSLQQTNKKLEEDIQQIKKKSGEDIRSLQQLSKKAEGERDEVMRTNETLQSNLKFLLREKETSKVVIGHLEEERSAARRTIEQLQEEREENRRSIGNLQAKKEENELEISQLKVEQEESRKVIGHLQGERAMMEGMYMVGSPTLQCVEKFRDLRDNAITNLLFDLTDNVALQDNLLPLLLAFHDFWSTQAEDQKDLTPEERKVLAQQIIRDPHHAAMKVMIKAEAAIRQIIKGEEGDGAEEGKGGEGGKKHVMDDEKKRKEMEKFYKDSAEVVARMEMCYPALEFLPKGRIPKKGSPLNSIIGQPFELDLGVYPVLESVDLPGLAAKDLNGTVFCKALLKFTFPKKQTS